MGSGREFLLRTQSSQLMTPEVRGGGKFTHQFKEDWPSALRPIFRNVKEVKEHAKFCNYREV